MKKIVITGATSFLGSAMVKEFLSAENEIYAVVRRNSPNIFRLESFSGIKIIELNLDEIKKLPEYIENADAFLHFAWDGSGSIGRADPEIQAKNYDYAMSALRAAEKINCKLFLFPGSQAEYGKYFDAIKEDAPCCPASEYGKNKLRFGTDALKMLSGSDMHFLHLRIFSVYGKNDRPGTLIESCIKTFLDNGTIDLGACTQKWNYLHVDDFASIVKKLVDRHFDCGDLEHLYNIGSTETRQLKEFVDIIHKKTGYKGAYRLGAKPENAEGSPALCPDIGRLNKAVNLGSLITFEQGVEKMINEAQRKHCIVCGQKLDGDPLISFDKMPASAQNIPTEEELANEHPVKLNLHQCNGCGLVQFDCEPVDYYKDVIRSGGYSTTMVELRRSQYSHLIETYALQGKDFLEVGCGQGEFLGVLDEFPVNAYGIENKADLAELACKKGLKVKKGFITDDEIMNDGKKYDVFLSFNFLEHQPDPNGMLQAIYKKLADDGMGLITVPSFEYILKYDGYYELIRDHIAYYTFDSLRVLTEKNGFEILEQEMINRDTLSIIVRKRKKISLDHWNSRFNLLKNEFISFIEDGRKNGRTLSVWGASHQGFTIVASLEIGKDIKYIVDSAPFKQGKYSPASHVKIVSPDEFYSDPTDDIIIIAPGYTDEIRNNIRKACGDKVRVFTLRSEHLEMLD